MAEVRVYVTLKPSLLDAQGRVVRDALATLGYNSVTEVRIGKFIELSINSSGQELERDVRAMCDRLLANPVIESYRFEVAE